MSIAFCVACSVVIDTDDDPDSTDFRENEFWCPTCRCLEGDTVDAGPD